MKLLVAVIAVSAMGLMVWGRPNAGTSNAYAEKILVANRAGFDPDAIIDPHLINPWGIALRPPGAGGHFWISNAGNLSTSTFIGDANGQPLHQDGLKIVYLSSPLISYEDGLANVTGVVYNAATDHPGQPLEFPVQRAREQSVGRITKADRHRIGIGEVRVRDDRRHHPRVAIEHH